MKNVMTIDLKYPYGKSQVYLGGSTVSVMARLIKMGFTVKNINLNIEPIEVLFVLTRLMSFDYFCISVIGAPYIPSVITLVRKLSLFRVPILIGGQVIEMLSDEQFKKLFANTYAIQIKNDIDLAKALGCSVSDVPSAEEVSHIPAWLALKEPKKLLRFLSHEMAMVLSQGCHFKCAFCAAKKSQVEKFKSMECFSADMRFLARSAKDFGIKKLEFYATSLDFFQNPKTVFRYLQELAEIQKEYGVEFKIRCLACADSFLNAVHTIGKEEFKKLMTESGLWCVGFGVDGADEQVWKAQKKNQNSLSKIKDALDLAQYSGIRAEALLIMGFSQDTFRTLMKCIIASIHYVRHWPNVILRPYLAKEFVPGNDNWKLGGPNVDAFIDDPQKFYNIDFCAIASRSTDKRFWHRVLSNFSYLFIIAYSTILGRCATSPLLPQGNSGLYGKFAKLFNRIVPFDR